MELDLLRRGTRLVSHPRLPDVPYLISLTRAAARAVELWSLTLQQSLPIVPVPLCDPDGDVALDLGPVVREIYDEAAYELSIDYGQLPPPAFSGSDLDWIRTIVAAAEVGNATAAE